MFKRTVYDQNEIMQGLLQERRGLFFGGGGGVVRRQRSAPWRDGMLSGGLVDEDWKLNAIGN